MDDFLGFFKAGVVPDSWRLDCQEDIKHEPARSYDETQFMVDSYEPPSADGQPEVADTPMPTVEVPDSQQSPQWPYLPKIPLEPSRTNLFNPSSKPPHFNLSNDSNILSTLEPNFFNSSNNINVAKRPRPNFFNPSSTNALLPTPTSIFSAPMGKVLGEIKDEDAEYDMYLSTPPYREPIESQAPANQHIPQGREIFFTPGSVVSFNPRRSVAKKNPSIQPAGMAIDEESDDDIKIIDATQASSEAKRKWAEQRAPFINDKEPNIKPEPVGDDEAISRVPKKPFVNSRLTLPTAPAGPHMLAILAAQRAELSKNKTVNNDSCHGTNSRRRHNKDEASSRISAAKKRRREGQIVEDDPEEVDAAMRAGPQEDHSWMREEPGEDDDKERRELQAKIDGLSHRATIGRLDEEEVYELARLRNRLAVKEKLLRCARGDPSRQPQEESLFVPADREELIARKRREQKQRERRAATLTPDPDSDGEGEGDGDGDDTGDHDSSQDSDEEFSRMLQEELDGEGFPGEEEISKPTKPRRKVAKTAREVFKRQEEDRREKERKKKQKTKGGRGRKAASKAKAIAGEKGKGVAKGRRSGAGNSSQPSGATLATSRSFPQRSGMDEVGQMIINDLMNSNPITERLQNPIFDHGAEPEMAGRHTKTTQLQRLLANIPEGTSAKDAKTDQAKLKQASRSFGYAKVKAVDGKWLIKGMKSTLYHHQLLGAQWMIQRELSDEAPYGGLLADSMGLGKTVQTLACMVGNPPGEKDCSRGVKATLIVVPSSVIEQWLDEIRNHAEASVFPKILRYKASSKIPVPVLRDLDIVVTSYQEVMRQFPFPSQKDREQIEKIGYKKWWKKACKSLGDLFGVCWYRVVLDEAHAIKNNSARTSLACQNLKSVFRWCLTGTPLLNRLEELFPYLRFLKANYSMDWKIFQRYFCDPEADDCQTRIATLLSYTMMRRTMKTTILNRAIITLPTPHPEVRYVDFSEEERIIYRITENRFRANLNQYFASGTATNNYAIFLVQLLRLRQCTSHPFMLERTIKESWTSSDLKELKTRLKSLGKITIPFYEQCQVWVDKEDDHQQAATERGDEQGESMPFGISTFGHEFNIDKALKTLSEKDMYSRVTCSLCLDLPRQPMMTDCNHIFCKVCITSYMHHKTAINDDDYMTCPTCDKIFASFKPYKGPQANDEDTMDGEGPEADRDTTGSGGSGGKKKRGKGGFGGSGSKGCDVLGFEPKVADSTWVPRSDRDDFPLVPSAKTAALKAILLKGFNDAPMDKVVIYVQFRLLAKIIGRMCDAEGWGFLYLTGECSLEHRSKVVKIFREDDDVKILISGLKCGGLGLNFPWANRCISLDLWWNHAVEQQAFGRIFRIGQKKETYMTRIIVKNTVDMRLLSMQMHKLKACDTAMESGEEKQKPSLSLRELAKLFGFLRTDADGEIVSIEPDYQDDD